MEVASIKDRRKIIAIRYFLHRKNIRDEALFVVGINTALRIGDLLSLKLANVMNENGSIADMTEIQEQKTGKWRRFPLNHSVKYILNAYLTQRPQCTFEEPLFPSRNGSGHALSRWSARRILHEAGKEVGVDRMGTHSLRKTFGYHLYIRTGGDLALVQKILNHSSSKDTLRYIGIDREEMDNTYLNLNL